MLSVVSLAVNLVLAAMVPPPVNLLRHAPVVPQTYPVHYDGPYVQQHGRNALTPSALATLPTSFNVRYHAGPVQSVGHVHAIYWAPTWTPPSLTAYSGRVDQYLKDIARGPSSIYGVAAQYKGVTNSTQFVSSTLDTTPYPKTLDLAAVEAELSAFLSKNHQTPTVDGQYFVFLQPNAPFKVPAPSVCSLHTAFNYQNNVRTPVVFAVVPYLANDVPCDPPAATTPSTVPGADDAIVNLSREQLEMATDPLGTGYFDDSYGEIGDLCFYDYGDTSVLGNAADIELNGNFYIVPEAFSQSVGACQPNLPATTGFPSIVWNGGPIQPTTTSYAIYWTGADASAFSPSFINLTMRFLKDVGGSAFYNVLTDYTGVYNGKAQQVANSATFGGDWVDTSAYPQKKLTYGQVVAEITKAIEKNPIWTPGITKQYFVFLGPTGRSPSGFCGVHHSYLPNNNPAKPPYIYAIMQFPQGGCGNDAFGLHSPNNDAQADRVITTVAHELSEMVSDPININGKSGWHDHFPESEVADVCANGPGWVGITATGANIIMNGHPYRVPRFWSAKHNACLPAL